MIESLALLLVGLGSILVGLSAWRAATAFQQQRKIEATNETASLEGDNAPDRRIQRRNTEA